LCGPGDGRGANTPVSLSSIQCLGAAMRFMCFRGPRAILTCARSVKWRFRTLCRKRIWQGPHNQQRLNFSGCAEALQTSPANCPAFRSPLLPSPSPQRARRLPSVQHTAQSGFRVRRAAHSSTNQHLRHSKCTTHTNCRLKQAPYTHCAAPTPHLLSDEGELVLS